MNSRLSFLRSMRIAVAVSGMLIAGCSGDNSPEGNSPSLEGCVTDQDCSGNRHCVETHCVYPSSNINRGPDCEDNDGDKYGANCPLGDDCDDSNNFISPAVAEISCNGIDENCNGADYCISQQCVDHDQDGFGEFCEKGNDCDDGDPEVNRKCLETMLKWKVRFDKVTAPTIGPDGTIYVGNEGGIKVLNPDTGEVIRDISLDCCFNCTGYNEQWFTPLLGNDGFLYGRCNAVISKVDVQRGEEVGRSRGYPSIGGISLDSLGNLYFHTGTTSGNMIALNSDLTEKWKTPLICGNGGNGSTSVGLDGTIYYNGCRHLTAFSPTGEIKWRYLGVGSIERGIALGNTRAFISDAASISAIDLQTGQKVWEHVSRAIFPPVVGPGNIIYGTEWLEPTFTSPGKVFALDMNGSLLWSHPVRSTTQSTPAVTADGTVYTFGHNSEVFASARGEKLWSVNLGDGNNDIYAPLVVDKQGTIYVVRDSTLFALQGDSPLADSPWPKQQHDLQNTGNKRHEY